MGEDLANNNNYNNEEKLKQLRILYKLGIPEGRRRRYRIKNRFGYNNGEPLNELENVPLLE